VDTVAVLQQIMVTYDAGLGHDVDFTCFSFQGKQCAKKDFQLIKNTKDLRDLVRLVCFYLISTGFLIVSRSSHRLAYHQECQVTNRGKQLAISKIWLY
jgi:hypothetical protein